MNITKLYQIVDLLKTQSKKRVVVAYANDEHTIEAVNYAVDMGIIEAILIGNETVIQEVCRHLNINVEKFKIVHEPIDVKAATLACDLINKGEGDLLMKGLLSTDKYMRAILNKEKGLCSPNTLLTHIAVIENPAYHKLLFASDCAIIPLPDLKQKQKILTYLIKTAKMIGLKRPKLAIIAATEQISANMEATTDAAIIAKMAERGQLGEVEIEGPLSLDLALDAETATIKKMTGSVVGDADCLLFPNIESGNVFYKCCTKFNQSEVGAFLAGAKVPCVLSSRGDTAKTKLYSIAIAALCS
jgi:phosphate butyryltransferase